MSKINPVNTASAVPVQVAGTDLTFHPASSTSPTFANLLRQVRAAAERVESEIYTLDAWMSEFRNAPDEVFDAVANVSAVLEFASCDIGGAIDDLHAAIRAR